MPVKKMLLYNRPFASFDKEFVGNNTDLTYCPQKRFLSLFLLSIYQVRFFFRDEAKRALAFF